MMHGPINIRFTDVYVYMYIYKSEWNGKEGRSSTNDEFDPYTSSFADEFKFK